MICDGFKRALSERAESFSREIENGAPTPFDAVKALIMGIPIEDRRHGFEETLPFKDISSGKALCKFPSPDDFPCIGLRYRSRTPSSRSEAR